VIQVQAINLYIPSEIQAGLDSGVLIRAGSVVRNTLGRFVTFLDEAPETVESVEKAVRAAVSTKSMPAKPAMIVAGALVVATGVAGAVVYAAKERRAGKAAMPECVKNYNASLVRYLDAIREERIDADIIDQLISDFGAVREFSDESGSITLDLSTKQGEALVKLVADYTRQLAEANSIDLDELQGQAQDSGNGAVVDLLRHLAVQSTIITKAA
jgi:hypothetical protein